MPDESANGHSAKIQSQDVTEGLGAAPARAMFRAMGYDDADLAQPLIGMREQKEIPPRAHLPHQRVGQQLQERIALAGGVEGAGEIEKRVEFADAGVEVMVGRTQFADETRVAHRCR